MAKWFKSVQIKKDMVFINSVEMGILTTLENFKTQLIKYVSAHAPKIHMHKNGTHCQYRLYSGQYSELTELSGVDALEKTVFRIQKAMIFVLNLEQSKVHIADMYYSLVEQKTPVPAEDPNNIQLDLLDL